PTATTTRRSLYPSTCKEHSNGVISAPSSTSASNDPRGGPRPAPGGVAVWLVGAGSAERTVTGTDRPTDAVGPSANLPGSVHCRRHLESRHFHWGLRHERYEWTCALDTHGWCCERPRSGGSGCSQPHSRERRDRGRAMG